MVNYAPSGLWSVRIQEPEKVLMEASEVIREVQRYWEALYAKRPVILPAFEGLVGAHIPRGVPQEWRSLQDYTLQDLKDSVKQGVGDDKAPGSNRVTAALVAELLEPVQGLLLHDYRAILRGAEVPESWHEAIIWLMPRGTATGNLDAYRPIALGRQDMRMLMTPLMKRFTAVDAQESPPLPGPRTLMRGHHIEGHGLTRHNVHHVSNLPRSEHVRSKGNQETATYRRRRRRLGIYPQESMVPMVTPLIVHVYHALGVLQTGPLEQTEDGASGLLTARRYRLAVEHTRGHGHAIPSHRALDVPGHRRLGVRVGSLHGCTSGSGSPVGSRSPEGGGLPASCAGGRCEDPFARPDADPCRPPVEGAVAGRVPRDTVVYRAVPPRPHPLPCPQSKIPLQTRKPHSKSPTMTPRASPRDGLARAR